ncbi:MAG TPA: hypothetical protein VIQ54_19460 [Polyangia bacterium]
MKAASALRDAMKDGRVVRVYRQSLEPDGYSVEGFVVGVEEDLVLMHVIDPAIVLDGFRVLRIADITSVDSSFESGPFLERALRLRRQRPRRPEGLRLDSVRAVIETAALIFPLITLHREREHKDSCWIGRLVEVDDLRVTIDYITPAAEWDGQERYALRVLTKIDFGGRYEEALASVAGLAPRPARRRSTRPLQRM